jgi:hypothetical protein
MTEGEKVNHKEAVKKVMLEHLTALGYPDMGSDEIMGELKNMWLKIEEAGLVTGDMNYQSYLAHANNAYLSDQFRQTLGI